MKFSELMERVRNRGVVIGELRVGGGGPDPEIRGVCEDSRKVGAGDLFVARSGSKKSGAEFIDEALAKGAVAAVTAEETGLSCAVPYARVADANLACAVVAHEVAGNPTAGMKMIGITGTKGKTTVAYLLRSVLKAAGHKVGMIGTVEIDDGVAPVPAEMTTPGSVELVELFCRMRENGVTHCVMEVSSHALHQHRVAGIDFAVAIFTNLTGDHLDYHKTMEEYAAAKAMLFEGLKEGAVAVVNADDKWVEQIIGRCGAKIVRCHIEMGLGQAGFATVPRPENGWSGLVTRMGTDGMQVNLVGPDEFRSNRRFVYGMVTPLVGRHNAYNLISVVAGAFALEMPDVEFMKGLRVLEKSTGAPGRLQPVPFDAHDDTPFMVFVDYAHTHDALENVLTALRATMGAGSTGPAAGGMLLTRKGAGMDGLDREPGEPADSSSPRQKHGTRPRLICLFGCGGDRDRTKRPKMGAVAERLADGVIVTSDNPRTENPDAIIEEICAGFSPGWKDAGKIIVEPDRRAAIRAAIAMAQPGDVVLLAGKGHENYQIIGTTKHHFDDVEEAEAALRDRLAKSQVPPISDQHRGQ